MTTRNTKAAIRYFVALVEDGLPRFSESPRPHLSEAQAEHEAQRLARRHPGKTFKVYRERIDAAYCQPPKRRMRLEIVRLNDGTFSARCLGLGKADDIERMKKPVGQSVTLGSWLKKGVTVHAYDFEVDA